MSGRWWRAYDEAVDDPKLCLLTDRQHRAWFNLCCITSQNGGTLPSVEAIAFKLRMPVSKVRIIIQELRSAGLIDDGENGAISPHNWHVRQYKSDVTDPTNATRQKRFRDRNRNGPNTVTDTVTITDTRDRAEQNRKKDGASAPPEADLKTDLFRRGREVLGAKSGSLIAKLLRSCGNEDDPKAIAKARARIEDASTKAKPEEWIGRILSPQNGGQMVLTPSGNPWPEGIT